MNPTKLLISTGGVLAGKWVADRFVIKSDESDTTGFILAKPGFGLDDVAEAVTIAVVTGLVHMLASRFGR